MLPRARDGARHEVLDDKRHDRGTWSCQSPPALVGQVLLCYWGLSASCKGAKRNFSFKAQFQDKNFTLKNRNQLLMQMNKQSQANHSTVNPPQKRAGRQATDASSASAFERAPGRALRGGRAGVVGRGPLLTWGGHEGRVSRRPGCTSCVGAVSVSPGRKSHRRRVSRFFIF